MGLYDININSQSTDLIPVEKRSVENKRLLVSLLSVFSRQWNIFLAYLKGADNPLSANIWAAGTYTLGNYIIYQPTGQVYECTVASTTEIPSTSTDWKLVLDSFIGTNESQYFNGSVEMLVYALNRRFSTTFVNDPNVQTSDIYLETLTDSDAMFQIGYTDSESSAIGEITVNTTEQLTYNDTVSYNNAFNIKIPVADYNALGATSAQRTASVKNFANKYIVAGIYYDVIPY